MKSLKCLFHPTTLCRIPTYFLSSHRRCMATDKNNNTKIETAAESQPEIGPSAPELQVNTLTGDHERK